LTHYVIRATYRDSMKPAEDCRPTFGTRPERLPPARRSLPRDLDRLLRVDWIDELFQAIDTRRR
jgi:hypothetical protein